MNQIKTVFSQKKEKINHRLRAIFANYKKTTTDITPSGIDTLTRLEAFTLGGKGIRGTLLMISARMYGFTDEAVLLDVAASLEILHSALLIHDDIMDNDLLRRGNPSIYAQYIENKTLKNQEFAKSMGICVGDIGFFMGLEIATNALSRQTESISFFPTLCHEYMIVAMAQMSDVFYSNREQLPSISEIMKVYQYKTARYTFSLPLSLGARIAGKDIPTIDTLNTLGENIGMVFQIQDDEIGLFSSEKISGKPVGSDLRENKKTLIRVLLTTHLTPQEKKQIEAFFSKPDPSQGDLLVIKRLIEKYHVNTEIADLKKTHQSKATTIIDSLFIDAKTKQLLHDLVSYVATRES